MLRIIVLLFASLLAGCNRSYWAALPDQRNLLEPVSFDAVTYFVAVNHPNARNYFVRDIENELVGNLWRWTGKKPTLRFRIPQSSGLSLAVDLVIPDVMFRISGPVTESFTVKEHPLGTVRYDSQGEKHFQKMVPAEWLRPGEENIVSAEIDKLWTPAEDDQSRGFVLVRAGFVQ